VETKFSSFQVLNVTPIESFTKAQGLCFLHFLEVRLIKFELNLGEMTQIYKSLMI
jgi:hypothetical protein